MKLEFAARVAGLLIVSLLTACGGGGSDSSSLNGSTGSGDVQPADEFIQIYGAGVKGPLAFADTKIFALDPSLPDFYDKTSPIATAITDQYAQVTGLAIPRKIKPPFVMTIGGDQAIDLDTGKPPVIDTLVTVITKDMLTGNRAIYATPLTTLAFGMTRYDSTPQTDGDTFATKYINTGPGITSIFAIDDKHPIDIFNSPVIIDANTDTLAEQVEAVYHRAAIESFSAKVYMLSTGTGKGLTTNTIIDRLAADLQSDGLIDNAASGIPVGGIAPTVVTMDPMKLSIPNTVYLVEDMMALMDEERTALGTQTDAVFQVDAINFASTSTTSSTDTSSTTVTPTDPVVSSDPTVTPNPVVVPQGNLALGQPTVASTQQDGSLPPGNAFDGNTATRWGSVFGVGPQWIYVDLGRSYPVNHVVLQWEAAYAKAYQIQVSADASTWTTVFSQTNSDGGADDIIFDAVTARYVRMYGTQRATNWGYSLWEFRVFGVTTLEPIATLSVGQIDFGGIDLGAISNPVPMVLTNSGTGPLTIENISISQGFLQTNNCSGFLEAGGNCNFDIQFVPTIAGSASGSLTVTTNDSAGTHTVTLSGAGNNGAMSATSLVASGPIVINGEQDVVISGLHITNPTGDCIQVLNGSTNILIENSEIGPCGKGGIAIRSSSSYVTVRNNYIHDTYENAVTSYEAHHIAVDKNVIMNVFSGYKMWTTSKGHLSFTNNFVKNIGFGYDPKTEFERAANVVQAVFASGPAIRITDNVAINVLGQAITDDLVGIYKSSGTATDPILIARNKFNGSGSSTSGFGMQLGDQGGGYIVAEDNILVNAGHGGLGVAHCCHITVRNNKVYSDNLRDYTNVGLGVWAPASGCRTDITVENNEITFWQAANVAGGAGKSTPFLNPFYVKSTGCNDIAGWGTNKFDTGQAQPAHLDSSLWNPAWNTPSFLPNNPYFYKDSVQ